MHAFTLAVALLAATPAYANFRISCSAITHERLDPLISPNKPSGHVHGVFGGSSFGMAPPTFAQMRKSKCTSCQVKQDSSSYWTPDLYFQWKNGSFSWVPNEDLVAYYYFAGKETEILPFPAGFRMITGNPFLRSNEKDPSQVYGAVNFGCLGSSANDTPYLPTGTQCPEGLRVDVFYPSCWDGKNVDSPTHTTHVAYSSNVNNNLGDGEGQYGSSLPGNGYCPKSHPKRLVSLTVSRVFNTFNFDYSKALNPKQPFVFAMGDPTGYGSHGDFINGWDNATLANAIDQCTFKDGTPEFCAPFTLQNTNQPDAPYAPLCQKTPTINEVVRNQVLPKLPGCNPVQKGPKRATPQTCTTPKTFSSPVAYSGPVPPVGAGETADVPVVLPSYQKYKYAGCYSGTAKSPALATSLKVSGLMTVQKCLTACNSKGFAYCGVGGTQGNLCYGSNKITSGSKALALGMCWTQCPGALNYCGGPKGLTVYSRSG